MAIHQAEKHGDKGNNRPLMKLLPVFISLLFILPRTGYGQLMPERIRPRLPQPVPLLHEKNDTARISFIGDVMQHGKQIRSALIPGKDPSDPHSYDYSAAFRHIRKYISGSDLTVANMEFPVGVPPYTGYPEFSAPLSIAMEASESGIGLFLTANNHLLDKSEAGIERTLHLYDSLGFRHTGAYRSREEEIAENPKILVINGIKTAFLNFTYGTNGFAVPPPYIVNQMDSIAVKAAIRRGFERGAELVVALPHWGEEYQLHPNGVQKEWAEMLRREGVRVIIGGHPHVPQSAEIELCSQTMPLMQKIKSITFYSLGNYISNQSVPDYTQLELLVTITAVRDSTDGSIELLPPEYHFLWCFKAGEFEKDYTVVPIEYFLNDPSARERVKGKEYERMMNTYRYVDSLNLFENIGYEREKN